MRRSSRIIRAGPQSNDKYPYKRKAEGRFVRQMRKGHSREAESGGEPPQIQDEAPDWKR